MLHNTCVTNIDKNLISIYRLCYTNGVLAEFFQAYFQVKDIITEVPLLQGKNSNRLYECHVSPCQATIIHGYLIKPINIFFFVAFSVGPSIIIYFKHYCFSVFSSYFLYFSKIVFVGNAWLITATNYHRQTPLLSLVVHLNFTDVLVLTDYFENPNHLLW